VLFVHSRGVHNQPYFVCSFVGQVMLFMLKPVLNGAEYVVLADDVICYLLPVISLDCIILFDVSP
jgi:hypothetical protein